ncbi:hypothetical protein [Halorubellus sp. PRR65]|nr:hypothetical protein [Halorubellus sp. PRR65]
MPNISENDGAVTLTVSGRRGPVHRSMTVEDAEEFLEDLKEAIEEAKGE